MLTSRVSLSLSITTFPSIQAKHLRQISTVDQTPFPLLFARIQMQHPTMTRSLISRAAYALLILHALLNIAQGVYCITHPLAWLVLAPATFKGSPDAAVQAIGATPDL